MYDVNNKDKEIAMIDIHTHSKLSHDGKFSIPEMVAEAENKGLRYYAITEHLDRDYRYFFRLRFCKQLNVDKYRREREAFLKDYVSENGMYVAFGIEAGHSKKSMRDTKRTLKGEKLDFVINSIHTIAGGEDPYTKVYYTRNKEKLDAYNKYLDAVYESLFVPYDYQVVGHIGYVIRYAPFEDISICTPEFHAKIDDILNEIVSQDKTIEINTRIRKEGYNQLPEDYMLKRFKELGGTKVAYASDAHRPEEIAGKYDIGVEAAKKAGFEYWTVYKDRQPVKMEF